MACAFIFCCSSTGFSVAKSINGASMEEVNGLMWPTCAGVDSLVRREWQKGGPLEF